MKDIKMEKFNLQKAKEMHKQAINARRDEVIKQAEEAIKAAIKLGQSTAKLKDQCSYFALYLQKYFRKLGFSVLLVKSATDRDIYSTLIVSGWDNQQNKKEI